MFEIVLFPDGKSGRVTSGPVESLVTCEEWLRLAGFDHQWAMSWRHRGSLRKAIIRQVVPYYGRATVDLLKRVSM